MPETIKARDLAEGDLIDMVPLIEQYGSDVGEADRMYARDEYQRVMAVSAEASKVPGVAEIAVIYTDLINLAVDASADVAVHARESEQP